MASGLRAPAQGGCRAQHLARRQRPAAAAARGAGRGARVGRRRRPSCASRRRSAPTGCSGPGGAATADGSPTTPPAWSRAGPSRRRQRTSTSCRRSPTASGPEATSSRAPAGAVGRGTVVADRHRGPAPARRGGPGGHRAARRGRHARVPPPAAPTWSTPVPGGDHPLRIRDGPRPGAALGRRVGDRGVGRSGPRRTADGRPRPRLLAGHSLNPGVSPRHAVLTSHFPVPSLLRQVRLPLLRCQDSVEFQQGSLTLSQ